MHEVSANEANARSEIKSNYTNIYGHIYIYHIISYIYVHDEHQKDPNVLSVEVARGLKHTCRPGISISIRVHTQMVLVRYSTSIKL